MPLFRNKIFLFFLLVATITYCLVEAHGNGDFYIFMSAAGSLWGENNIYELHYAQYYNYFYSVLFALFLKTFYSLPFFWIKFYWLMLNAFLFYHLFWLLVTAPILNKLENKHKQVFLVMVFIFSFRFFHENIHTSQITILILWCCVYGLRLIHSDKPLIGSAVLAIGINLKLLPIVFLPYLFFRGYFKAVLFTILIYAGSLFLPSLIIGNHYNILLLKSWLGLMNPVQTRHVLDVDERSFHGLSTLLSTLLVKNVPDMLAMNLKRNIADVSLPQLTKILLAVRLILISLTLYFLNWKPFLKASNILKSHIEISYILLLIPLIFPHQQHYAFLFIVPAFSVVLCCLQLNFKSISRGTRTVIIGILFLIYLASNLKILLGEFNHYYEHFKILTYAALLLIPLLIWASRQNGARSEVLKN